jgi:hypothetical protein
MISDWNDILTAAIRTLPELHRDIVVRTMQTPGKRKRLFYSEAMNIWNLDREEFDRQRESAFEAVRLYLIRQGVTCPGDLALKPEACQCE